MADHPPTRLEKNAPGDWYTTGECLWCGAPEHEAPELMHPLSDDDLETYFVRQPVTAAEIDHACAAARSCCVTSIRYGGRDREVIHRLGNTGEYSDFVVDDDGALRPAAPWRPSEALRRAITSAPTRRRSAATLKADSGIESISQMRDPIPQPNVVSAVRNGGRSRDPRMRRRIFGGLLLLAVAAVATVALASARDVRGWAAVVALVCVLTIMIAWLAGASRSLSRSERDPSDFSD